MATPPLPRAEVLRRVHALESALQAGYRPPGVGGRGPGAMAMAAKSLGLAVCSIRPDDIAMWEKQHGITVDWGKYRSVHAEPVTLKTGTPVMAIDNVTTSQAPTPIPAREVPPPDILKILKRGPMSLGEIAAAAGMTRGGALDVLERLIERGVEVSERPDGKWATAAASKAPAFATDSELPVYESRPDGTYVFGAIGDNHYGSKYARDDVAQELYDWYARQGVDRVFNTGNWCDGDARFNQHDLLVHGMDPQLRNLAEKYPRRDGITTYAVAGDDHEGWWSQREGIDPGRAAARAFQAAGRSDWVDLGYMEAHIRLRHAQTGAESILAVVHPGGGSAYALSYSVQKIIESLDGGEKPAVALYGHYHKLWAGNIRNVWVATTGCTQDQTPFMRKKKIEAHVGGLLIELRQDPESGAITEFTPRIRRFFNRGFYNLRWSHGGGVNLPERK